MKKLLPLSLLGIAALTLSGCATVINGRYQNLAVNSNPQGASCVLQNGKGKWYVKETPQTLLVHRSGSAMRVTCRKQGYLPTTRFVHPKLKAAVAGNVLIGGLIGAGVDTVNGAAFGYPTEANVKLERHSRVASLHVKDKSHHV